MPLPISIQFPTNPTKRAKHKTTVQQLRRQRYKLKATLSSAGQGIAKKRRSNSAAIRLYKIRNTIFIGSLLTHWPTHNSSIPQHIVCKSRCKALTPQAAMLFRAGQELSTYTLCNTPSLSLYEYSARPISVGVAQSPSDAFGYSKHLEPLAALVGLRAYLARHQIDTARPRPFRITLDIRYNYSAAHMLQG